MADTTQVAAPVAAPEPITPFTSDQTAMERIAGLLDDRGDEIQHPEAPVVAAEDDKESPEPGDAAPAEEPTSGDGKEASDPAKPIIAAPASWDEDAKKAFAELPPHLQQVVADRESARQAELRRGQNEVAESKKALDAKASEISKERDTYSQQLTNFLTVANQQFQDEFASIDWDRLAAEDPGAWVAKKAAYERKAQIINAAANERASLAQQAETDRAKAQKDLVQREWTALQEVVPAFKDPAKAKALTTEVTAYLREVGFSDQELSGLIDHRTMRVAIDAMDAKKLRADRTKTATKVAAAPPKVAEPTKPVAKTERQAEESKALIKQLGRSHRTADQAEIVAKFLT